MEYRGIQYQIVQMTGTGGYKWTVELNGRTKIGTAPTRILAVRFAETAIEKAIKKKEISDLASR